jgi:hypothetical protein
MFYDSDLSFFHFKYSIYIFIILIFKLIFFMIFFIFKNRILYFFIGKYLIFCKVTWIFMTCPETSSNSDYTFRCGVPSLQVGGFCCFFGLRGSNKNLDHIVDDFILLLLIYFSFLLNLD